jgi:hypothetical protein
MLKKPEFRGFKKKKSCLLTEKSASIQNDGFSLLDDIDKKTDIYGNERSAVVGERSSVKKSRGISPL